MKRINRFRLRPTKEQEKALFNLCEMSVVLWNKINYVRRQSFFNRKFEFKEGVKGLYDDFKRVIGSTTTQQIIRKNDECWRSFFKLLKLKKNQAKLPKHIRKISPSGYWKDRRTGKRKIMTVVRNDSYRIQGVNRKKQLVLPKGLKVRITGEIRWRGKQGRLEIHYDELTGQWYVLQSVEVQNEFVKSIKEAYVDLGIINIITAWIEGENQSIAFSGRPILSDWWYWNKKIAKYKSRLKTVNNKNSSKRLKKLYRKRRLRFRNAVNTIVYRFVNMCYKKGVGGITVGDISYIRENNDKNRKINSMIHNFWSLRYIMERLKITAENFEIRVKFVNESYTSSICPKCGSKSVIKRKRLFKCLNCGLEAHRDVIGALNIALVHNGGGVNGVLAHPLLLRVENPAKVKAYEAGMIVKPLEARIP